MHVQQTEPSTARIVDALGSRTDRFWHDVHSERHSKPMPN